MRFSLQEFETTHIDDATILPLFAADQAKTEAVAQAVQVNPNNDGFQDVVSTPNCHMNSRINKIKITEYCYIPAAVDVPDMIYSKAIFSWGLGDSDIVAADGSTILATAVFQKNADTISPNYSGTNLLNAGFMHTEQDGLTADGELETVPLTPIQIRDMRHGELGPKLRKMIIGPYTNRVHKDFPYYSSRWYTVPGSVKRMNAFTGCFLYVGMNETTTKAATGAVNMMTYHFDGDLTIDEESLSLHYLIEYNEYNDSFDQFA